MTPRASSRGEAGYFNAVQVFPFSPGALYQIYAAPGQITDIALEPGEQLIGSGPVAAGDTVRWVVGDTESGSGDTRRVHIMVKPTRPVHRDQSRRQHRPADLSDRAALARKALYALGRLVLSGGPDPAVRGLLPPTPFIPESTQRRYRYTIEGDNPPGGRSRLRRRPQGLYRILARHRQGEMPPLFVIGPDGKPELVNYRAYGNVLIVDRLFAAAELRLGGENQQKVRIIRTDGRPS